jgi:ribosomal small subunit protein bTHX
LISFTTLRKIKSGEGILPAFYYFCNQNQIKMGRGDKRTKKGKITLGSFGKSRLARRVKKVAVVAEKKED